MTQGRMNRAIATARMSTMTRDFIQTKDEKAVPFLRLINDHGELLYSTNNSNELAKEATTFRGYKRIFLFEMAPFKEEMSNGETKKIGGTLLKTILIDIHHFQSSRI